MSFCLVPSTGESNFVTILLSSAAVLFMGTVSTGYPFRIAVRSNGISGVSPHKWKFSRYSFPLQAEFSRINLFSGSVFSISFKVSKYFLSFFFVMKFMHNRLVSALG